MVEISATSGNTGQHDQTASRAAAIAAQQKEIALENQRATPPPQSHGFDAAGNRVNDRGQIVQFAGQQAKESYLADRGYGNTGKVIDQTKAEKADFSNLGGYNQATRIGSTKEGGTAYALDLNEQLGVKNDLSGYTSKQGPTSYQLNINEGIGVGDSLSGKTIPSSKSSGSSVFVGTTKDQQDFDTSFSGAEKKGATINIYNKQGARVGSVKADEKGRQTLESLGDTQGTYFREARGPSGFDSGQQRSFADFISSEGKSGAVIDLFSGGKKVGQVSGSNAYRDVIPFESKYGDLRAKVNNEKFQEQNKETANFIAGINARNDPSYNFNIRDQNGKIVKTTTGQRAFYDFMRSNLDNKGGVSIEAHFSNTPQAAGERLGANSAISKAPDNNQTETLSTFAAITGAGPQPSKAGGGLAGLARNTESFFVGLGSSLESAFVNQYKRNEVKGNNLESAKGFLFGPSDQLAKDLTHTIAPISVTSLATKGQIESRNPELTPEASSLTNRTSSPSLLGVAMGKEPVTENQMYYTASGALTAYGLLEGAKFFSPFRVVERPVQMQREQNLQFNGIGRDVTSQPIQSQYKGVALGFGGRWSIELVGRTPSGYVAGKPSFEKVAPPGFRVVAKDDVGQEVSNIGNDYSIFHGTNPKMYDYLAKTGRTAQPNAGEIMQALNTLDKSGMKVASRQPAREITAGATSGSVVDKSLMEGISQRQGRINILRPSSGGQAKEIYGSNISAATLSPRGLGVMNRLFPSQDVDIAKSGKGSPKSRNLINNFVEAQRPALAETLHTGILEGQGLISKTSESGLFGTDTQQASTILNQGKPIPESQSPSFAESSALEKSSKTRKKPVIIRFVKSEKSLVPDYQLTTLQGVKIGTSGKTLAGVKVAEEGKIAEIPSHLEEPKGSSLKRGGQIFGNKIDQKTIKYKIKDSDKTIKGATENFQYQTQLKKMGTLQTQESIAQQGGTTAEQRAFIGGKVFIGEATHSGGKAMVRGLEHAYDKADILMERPETYQEGLELRRSADIIKGSQSDFFKVNYNKTASDVRQDKTYNVSSGGPSSYSSGSFADYSIAKSIISGKSGLSGKSSSSSIFNPSQSSSQSGKSSKSNISSASLISGKSGISSVSLISGKSGFSGFSGKSGISGISGKSGVSGLSGLSAKSGPSGFSASSSGFSGVSGPSGFSGTSSSSGSSSSSGVSGKSGSGSSSFGGSSTISTLRKFPSIKIGSLGIRRINKTKEGPTALLNLGVNNIFASAFSIKVGRNNRYEF